MPKPVYLGGEIMSQNRGLETVVITRNLLLFRAYSYETTSPEFIQLTGIGTMKEPVERIYQGISRKCREEVLIEINEKSNVDILSLDKRIVNPRFIK
ncbi:MAG: hypothetical protein AABW79_01240 [Nanoarchaeota archaeon]